VLPVLPLSLVPVLLVLPVLFPFLVDVVPDVEEVLFVLPPPFLFSPDVVLLVVELFLVVLVLDEVWVLPEELVLCPVVEGEPVFCVDPVLPPDFVLLVDPPLPWLVPVVEPVLPLVPVDPSVISNPPGLVRLMASSEMLAATHAPRNKLFFFIV
jgi:hypothetical protein